MSQGFTSSIPVPLPVGQGGTGKTSATAYAVQCAGTTSGGAQQSIASVGTSGQVLTSNGAGTLPTFEDAAGDGVIKAWVAFTGQGTVAIDDSFNVTSITDNDTGNYTINLTITFATTDYCFVVGVNRNDATDGSINNLYSKTTSSVRVSTQSPATTVVDVLTVSAAFLGAL